MYVLQAAADRGFEGFSGLSMALLVAAVVASGVWLAILAVLWLASRPRFPDAGPPTADMGPEPPAIANLLVNRWRLTRVAMAATLVDLAARRVLGLEDYAGERHVVRIRSNQPANERFTAYEQQVLDFVRARATDNSAPVEALDLGQSGEAQNWWRRFEKAVQKDARDRGVARGRWTSRDRVMLGSGLAVVLGLLAASFSIARVGGGPDEDDLDPLSWFAFAGIAWVVAAGWFARNGALRDTPAGRVACARWLGFREHLRRSAAFGDVPPGSVTVWERQLAYATGFGLARATARALPFATDDPNTAWSRYGGEWRQVRISYPRRWGFGEPPWQVLVQGLALTALWGAIGFVILPIFANFAWDFGRDVLDDLTLGGRAELWLAGGILGAVALIGSVVLYRLVDGAGKLILGAMDVGRMVTITGEVANVYSGRVALADGIVEEVRAWTPPPAAAGLTRGLVIRATMSPRLCHVTRVEVLQAAPGTAETPNVESGPSVVAPAEGPPDADAVSRVTGIPMSRAASAGASAALAGIAGAFMETFTDGANGMVRVFMTPIAAAATGIMGADGLLPGQVQVSVAGKDGRWTGDRMLSVALDSRMLGVEVDLPGLGSTERRAVAVAIAEQVLQGSGGTGLPTGGVPAIF